MSTHQDDQGSGADAYGRPRAGAPGPEHGAQEPAPPAGPQYPPPEYGGQPYAQPWHSGYEGDRAPYEAPGYAPPEYGQAQYGQADYGQPQFPHPGYGQQQYAPGAYVPGGAPAYGLQGPVAPGVADTAPRPGGVVTAAVLGFLFGAVGIILSFAAIVLGAVASGASGSADSSVPGLGSVFGAVGGAIIGIGVLALIWTVVMIWGSVWALTGRSRVLLLTGGAIALVLTLLGLFGNLANSGGGGGSSIVSSLVFLAAAVLIVVLLSAKDAAAFYASHRSARARR
jgi:hypothetical protein